MSVSHRRLITVLIPGLHPRFSDSVALGQRMYISSKFPGDVDGIVAGTTRGGTDVLLSSLTVL